MPPTNTANRFDFVDNPLLMPAMPKKPGRPAGKRGADESSTRQRILDAAMEVFAMKGFDGCTMRDIGAHSGLHNSLIAYYFNTKQLMWLAVVEQINERAQPSWSAIRKMTLDEFSPLHTRIDAALKLLVDDFIRQPALGLFMGATTPWHGERYEAIVNRLVDPYREALVPLLTEGMARHIIRRQDPETLFLILIHGISRAVCVRSQGFAHAMRFARAETPVAEDVWQSVRAMIAIYPTALATEPEPEAEPKARKDNTCGCSWWKMTR